MGLRARDRQSCIGCSHRLSRTSVHVCDRYATAPVVQETSCAPRPAVRAVAGGRRVRKSSKGHDGREGFLSEAETWDRQERGSSMTSCSHKQRKRATIMLAKGFDC